MENEQLLATLRELHRELNEDQKLGDEARSALRELAADIHRALDLKEPTQEHVGPISDRVKEMVAEFEADHPNVTSLLSQMTEFLARIGI